MMFSTPVGPPRHAPTPTRGPDLHVHPQRDRAIDATERWLVCTFLERYVVWLSRKRRIDGVRNVLGLLTEVAGTRVRAPVQRLCRPPDGSSLSRCWHNRYSRAILPRRVEADAYTATYKPRMRSRAEKCLP